MLHGVFTVNHWHRNLPKQQRNWLRKIRKFFLPKWMLQKKLILPKIMMYVAIQR
ncbi:hypothetical protein BLA29_010354 [Euroglyphus maynei]|uniref:Uncharacterized protein n=1 Tax=Euroglyphus maynei TaxID=6958 RepID=A0A1Y3B0E8_EURMA|nr:hypothetical protein BLA29_010354 [Euroglyphus maynei]